MKVSHTLFEQRSLSTPEGVGDLLDQFEESKAIVAKAIIDNNPYAVCLMLSGGDDSITALHVAQMLGVKIDFIIHGVTGTGLPEVREYVRESAIRSMRPYPNTFASGYWAERLSCLMAFVLRNQTTGPTTTATTLTDGIITIYG